MFRVNVISFCICILYAIEIEFNKRKKSQKQIAMYHSNTYKFLWSILPFLQFLFIAFLLLLSKSNFFALIMWCV